MIITLTKRQPYLNRLSSPLSLLSYVRVVNNLLLGIDSRAIEIQCSINWALKD